LKVLVVKKVQVTAGDIVCAILVEGFEIGDTIFDYENQKL
jgi:hypothetical protein